MDSNFLSKNKRVMIASLICVVVLAGVFLGVAVPFLKKVYEKKDSLEGSRMKLEMMREETKKLKEYQSLNQELWTNSELLDRAVIKEDTVVVFIKDLEAISSSVGSKIKISSYQPPQLAPGAATSELSSQSGTQTPAPSGQAKAPAQAKTYFMLTLEGRYSQFLTFLYELENTAYAFEVNSIQLSTAKVSSQGQSTEEKKEENKTEAKIVISFIAQK